MDKMPISGNYSKKTHTDRFGVILLH